MMSEVVREVSVKRLAFRVVLHDALQRLLVRLILRFSLGTHLRQILGPKPGYFMYLYSNLTMYESE